MTKEKRIETIRKFHIKHLIAKNRKDGDKSSLYYGLERRAKQLFREEHNATPEEIAEIIQKVDEEIEKAGINADQFVALYHSI